VKPVTLGIVGLGTWGPILARAFSSVPNARLTWLCDTEPAARRRIAPRHPGARVTANYSDLLADDGLDGIVIATPPATHAELALAALERNKHIFVEKPLTIHADEAERIVREASRRNRCLVVGHVLLHHPAIRKLKEVIETHQLGHVYYLYGNRQSLGRVRSDENALWSLGPHDIAVLLYLLDEAPLAVSARGESYLQKGIADVVFCHLRFPTGVSAHLHLSWLDPHKLRKLTVVGSKGMAVVDDMETERKLTIYESSAVAQPTDSFGEYVNVSFGDIVSPRLPNDEPLRLECEHFVRMVRSASPGAGSMRSAAAVVRVLEALQLSLDRNGAEVAVLENSEGRTTAPPVLTLASSK
jgi:predicted dehydrogenase